MKDVIYGIHHLHTENIGDLLCSPLRYFSLRYLTRFQNLPIGVENYGGIPGDVVIGGGGLIHPGWDVVLEKIANSLKHDCVCWGIGTNYHGSTEAVHPDWLRGFDLVGVRDVGVKGYDFVPCASCCHLEFQAERPAPTHDAVVYEHASFPIPIGDFPKRNNNASPDEMFAVLDFLASGEVVISNSYHGLYWAALLGRKVICYEPMSARFHHVPWRQAFATGDNLRDVLKQVQRELNENGGLLADCIERNVKFSEKVKEIIE